MTTLLTLPEVAARYRTSPETLRLHVLRGTARVMPCMGGGRGRAWRWRAADVEADLADASISDRKNRRRAAQKESARG